MVMVRVRVRVGLMARVAVTWGDGAPRPPNLFMPGVDADTRVRVRLGLDRRVIGGGRRPAGRAGLHVVARWERRTSGLRSMPTANAEGPRGT